MPLEDLALPDRESVFHTPRAGDWLLLAVLVFALLGIGLRLWFQLGLNDHTGRAIFFGLALVAVYWAAIVYTFKLSLSVRVGPKGITIVRGPWHVELRWNEVTRLMERPQTVGRHRYRWLVALARDSRRIQVRDDALLDYDRFRREVYIRYRLWRDHGGTWGATGGGPITASEQVTDEARWWVIAALIFTLPAGYCAFLLPGAVLVGYALAACAITCAVFGLLVFLRRQTYSLDGKGVQTRGLLRRTYLTWREISKVEHARAPFSGLIVAGVALGRLILRIASRGDAGIRSFAWSPRVPEYITLRGGGRRARIRLHRLAQPEELLAWVEFYGGVRRAARSGPLQSQTAAYATSASRPSGAPSPSRPVVTDDIGPEPDAPSDLSGVSGPADPWAQGRRGEPAASRPTSGLRPNTTKPSLDTPPDEAPAAAADQADDAWLRETSAHLSLSASGPATPAATSAISSDDTLRRPGIPSQPQPFTTSDPFDNAPTVPTPAVTSTTPPPISTPLYTPGGYATERYTPAPSAYPSESYPSESYPSESYPTESYTPGAYSTESYTPAPGAYPAEDFIPASHTPMPSAYPTESAAPDDDSGAPSNASNASNASTGVPNAPQEPEPADQPWSSDQWQPPILPRFGPGSASPFRRNDDDDR